MIGKLLARIRTDKGLTKTELSKLTGVNIGHLTHIEKEDRNPSFKTLKTICDGLDVPVQPLLYTLDRNLTDEQEEYSVINHINYDSIPIVNSIIGYSICPKNLGKSSFIMRSYDDSMSPKIEESDFVYIELNAPLNNKDIGLFQYQNQLLIRKFIIRKKDMVLRAESSDVEDIVVTKNSDFSILGKILGKNNKNMTEVVEF